MFKRAMVRDEGGGVQEARAGDGWLAAVSPFVKDSAIAEVIPAGSLSGGLYVRIGLTADTTDTTDDAVNILDTFPTMDIGETVMIGVSNQSPFALTIAGGLDVTVVGKDTVPASGFMFFLVRKDSPTAITVGGL